MGNSANAQRQRVRKQPPLFTPPWNEQWPWETRYDFLKRTSPFSPERKEAGKRKRKSVGAQFEQAVKSGAEADASALADAEFRMEWGSR